MTRSLLARLEEAEASQSPTLSAVPEQVKPGRDQVLRMLQDRLLADEGPLILSARSNEAARARLEALVLKTVLEEGWSPERGNRLELARELVQDIVGFGPLEPLMADAAVTEIMVNGFARVYAEREGVLLLTPHRFRDDAHLVEVIRRIVAPIGRRVDASTPFVDARLPDGSRVHAILPPLSLDGPSLTIRRFRQDRMDLEQLLQAGALTQVESDLLRTGVREGLNILVAGGTGAGKTTLLNALARHIDERERVITIEDAAELQLGLPHVVRLEARPANLEGRGEVSVRELLRNALRMRPDRLVIGELRGPEAWDALNAWNTGHRGCLSTVHANSARDAVERLAAMALTAGDGLPYPDLIRRIHETLDVVVQVQRAPDGRRRVVEILRLKGVGT